MNKIYLLILIICILIATSLGYDILHSISTKNTLKSIAYDVNKRTGYTVYIKEKTSFAPYLVLTHDYNGEALLLRRDLLEEPRAFNKDSYGYSGYYKDSCIDKYLNDEFIYTLDPKIQDFILESKITITAISSLGLTGEDTEDIRRKVFLLSYTELDLDKISVACEEGRALKYFEKPQRRIAYMNGEPDSWWLRTSDTWNIHTVYGIGPCGIVGPGPSHNEIGIRPAFCLKNDTKIKKSEDVIQGKSVYIIDQ